MATAFGVAERTEIRSSLRRAAWQHACLEGMKYTSIDRLCAEAGISKGAFYHFYESKELLFLEVLSLWHRQIFAKVEAFMAAHRSAGGSLSADGAGRAASAGPRRGSGPALSE